MKKFRLDTFIFILFIAIFGIANLLNTDKPTISLQENRTLAKKPIFSVQSIFDKSYFGGLNNYYSDTVLWRENMIQMNVHAKKNFGIGDGEISIVVVGNDPVPTKTPKPSEKPPTQSTEPTKSPTQPTENTTESPTLTNTRKTC